VLYSFGANATDAQKPYTALVQGRDGNFYGTTPAGGAHNAGAMFQLTPAGVETVVYSFGASTGDGTSPYATLMTGFDGNLYGTTQSGGAYTTGSGGGGTIFEIAIN